MKSSGSGLPRQHVNSHLCLLSVVIGEANSLRTNIASNNTFVIWFGLPSDIEAATMLLHSVAHQMVRCADAFVRSRSWADERDRENLGAPMTAQKARKSYYSAYVRTIGERLMNARKQAETQYDRTADGPSAALVLRGKELEVREYYDQASRARGTWRGIGAVSLRSVPFNGPERTRSRPGWIPRGRSGAVALPWRRERHPPGVRRGRTRCCSCWTTAARCSSWAVP